MRIVCHCMHRKSTGEMYPSNIKFTNAQNACTVSVTVEETWRRNVPIQHTVCNCKHNIVEIIQITKKKDNLLSFADTY